MGLSGMATMTRFDSAECSGGGNTGDSSGEFALQLTRCLRSVWLVQGPYNFGETAVNFELLMCVPLRGGFGPA